VPVLITETDLIGSIPALLSAGLVIGVVASVMVVSFSDALRIEW
jgi:hypothetical protein